MIVGGGDPVASGVHGGAASVKSRSLERSMELVAGAGASCACTAA